MLRCDKNLEHNKITTCINQNCHLRFKLLCLNCDYKTVPQQHEGTCQFAELKTKLNYFEEINQFRRVNNISKFLRRNKIKLLQYADENEEYSKEQIEQFKEINQCIHTYNNFFQNLLNYLFKFISNQRTWYLNNHELDIGLINKQTALMRLQLRNYSTIIKDLSELVHKNKTLNDNFKQIKLKTQSHMLQGFCNDIIAIINHFQLQKQGANTWFSEENTKVVRKHNLSNSKELDIQPSLIKFTFDGFFMGEYETDNNVNLLKVYSQINEESFNHFKLRLVIKMKSQIIDYDFSSCESYMALLQEDGFHLFELRLDNNINQINCQSLDLQSMTSKYWLKENFNKVQFYFRRILLAIQNTKRLVIFNYERQQLVYSINSEFDGPFIKEMSMITEFLLIKSNKSLDIFEQNGELKEVTHSSANQVQCYLISQNCKYLLVVSIKDLDNNQNVQLFTRTDEQFKFTKLLMSIKVKNIVKLEFSKDSNYIYLLQNNTFEVIDTYILQQQQEKNIFFSNKDKSNPYINFFQTIEGDKLYLVKKNGEVIVNKKFQFNKKQI